MRLGYFFNFLTKYAGSRELIKESVLTLLTKKVDSKKRMQYAGLVAELQPTKHIYFRTVEEQFIFKDHKFNSAEPRKIPWSSNGETFKTSEVLPVAMQFTDEMQAQIPEYLFPGEQIEKLTAESLAMGENFNFNSFYTQALVLADNKPVAAAYLCMMTARLHARGLDFDRQFPGQIVGRMEDWYKLVPQIDFDRDISRVKRDWAGEFYYFFTHFFVKLHFELTNTGDFRGNASLLFDKLIVSKGSEIMKYARAIAASQPQMSNYTVPSHLGRTCADIMLSEITKP